MKNLNLFRILQIVAGLIFVVASAYKIMTPGAFAHQIYNFKILPVWVINPAALVVPWLQLLCGLCLIFNRFALGASFIIALLMLSFQIALASALLRGLNIACGCFKSGGSPATWWTFARDFIILTLTWFVFLKTLCQKPPFEDREAA